MSGNNKEDSTFTELEITSQGLAEVKQKLDYLINEERKKVLGELSEARGQGDLSENADYDAAKNKQAEVESEILKLQDILARAKIIIEKKTKSIVEVGSIVTYIKDSSKEVNKVQIVGPIQVDPWKEIPMIGYDSVLAKALLGRKIQETILVNSLKPYKITIQKVE